MLASIQLNSNQPGTLKTFFDNLEKNTSEPENIEVLVNIDLGDKVMAEMLEAEKEARDFHIDYIETELPGGFFDLWKPLNHLLKKTNPDAYFVINVSDEFMFITPEWDKIVKEYVGYYPDDIFRLRCSKHRFRNYTDVWECGFAPDSLAFYTKKWLDLGGDWNPCFGPDSFQQCVAYYMFTSDPFSHYQCNRDIPLANVNFSGEGVSIGLTPEQNRIRTRGHVRTWFILMSHKFQQEAKRRAMILKAHIFSNKESSSCSVIENSKAKAVEVVTDESGETKISFKYKVSWVKTFLVNNYRKLFWHYYAGGGEDAHVMWPIKGFFFRLWAKHDWFFNFYESYRAKKTIFLDNIEQGEGFSYAIARKVVYINNVINFFFRSPRMFFRRLGEKIIGKP